jgi:hypothetical protein
LHDASDAPVVGALSMQFRLYDVASGGVALWSETKVVQVIGGRFRVELGDENALAEEWFNRQLWIGIRIGADVELQPRSRLSAAPYAMRALQAFQNEMRVPAEGSATENGAALLAAMVTADAAGGAPFVVRLDAGSYDLASNALSLPDNTVLVGAGRDVSFVTGSAATATILIPGRGGVRALGVGNTGAGSAAGAAAVRIDNPNMPDATVTLEDVSLVTNTAATTALKRGLIVCNTGPTRVLRSTVVVQGGSSTIAIAHGCDSGGALSLDDVLVQAIGAGTETVGVRSETGRIELVRTRVYASDGDDAVSSSLIGLDINVAQGDAVVRDSEVQVSTQTGAGSAEGLAHAVRAGQLNRLSLQRTRIAASARADDVRGVSVSATAYAELVDAETIVQTSDAPGASVVYGVILDGGVNEIRGGSVVLNCESNNGDACIALRRSQIVASALPLHVVDTTISVSSTQSLPVAAPANLSAMYAEGMIRVERSSIRQLGGNGFAIAIVPLQPATVSMLTVSQSVLETTAAAGGANGLGCAISAQQAWSFTLASNQVIGGVCPDPNVGSCAGTTTRGNGFVAVGCPIN